MAAETPEVSARLLALLEGTEVSGGKIYDVNLVATAQEFEIQGILTNNVTDFQLFSDLIYVVPL